MTTVYGIPNCASVKKARQWLDTQGVAHAFHDFKKQGVSRELLERWIAATDLNQLLNRKGTTWRKLSAEQQALAEDQDGAINLMQQYPSLIKRPVLECQQQTLLGFDPTRYMELFDR